MGRCSQSLLNWLNLRATGHCAPSGYLTRTKSSFIVRWRRAFQDLSVRAGSMAIGPKGGSCGTAVYRKQPVYVHDILTDPVWDHYRHRLIPCGIRAVWSRPLFTSEVDSLGRSRFIIVKPRSPDGSDLQLIENAVTLRESQLSAISMRKSLRLERDRLHCF